MQLCPDFQEAALALTSAGLAMLLLPSLFPLQAGNIPWAPMAFPLREELRDASALELIEFSAGTCHSLNILG